MKKRQSLFITVILFIFIYCHQLSAQQLLNRQWTSFHNGALTGLDHSNAIVCDSLGNSFVTGQSYENSVTGSITTIKYDVNGNMVWIDNYKGVIVTAENEGMDICLDPFENILVTGTVAFNDGDLAVLKFNQGGRIWAKDKEPYWFGSGIDFAREIATDAAGNIYCVASIESLSGQMQDLYTLKCDSGGNNIWGVDYSSASGDDWAEGLAVTPDGHCFSITSSFNFFGSATYDMQTLHYDSSGNQQWISSYNYSVPQSEDYPVDVICDGAYNTWICGAADVGSGTDMAVMKQNIYGTRLWVVTYNGSANTSDSAIAVSVLPNNLTVVTGRSKELINGFAREAITTMLIDSGIVLWTNHYYGDSLNAIPTAMKTDAQGRIYICGYYQTQSQGLNGVVLVYDQTGALTYYDQFNGSANLADRFNDIVVDHQNGFYVTGQSFSAIANSDYVTIKYSLTGTSNIQNASFMQDFVVNPNPASSVINIRFFQMEEPVVIITDVTGKIIKEEKIHRSNDSHQISCEGIRPGVYFIQAITNNLKITKKLLIQ